MLLMHLIFQHFLSQISKFTLLVFASLAFFWHCCANQFALALIVFVNQARAKENIERNKERKEKRKKEKF
jgi:hypothetical protein